MCPLQYSCSFVTLLLWQNEDELAAQLVGFFQQFLEVFNELKGKKLYLTGESVSLST